MRKTAFLLLALYILCFPVGGVTQTEAYDFVPASASGYRTGFISEMRAKGYTISDFEEVDIRRENPGELVRYEAELDSAYSIKLSQMASQDDRIISCYAGWRPRESTDITTAISEMKEIWQCVITAAGPSMDKEEADALLNQLLDGAARTKLTKETEYNGSVRIAGKYVFELTLYKGYVSMLYTIPGNL